jgi:hypothetical protein
VSATIPLDATSWQFVRICLSGVSHDPNFQERSQLNSSFLTTWKDQNTNKYSEIQIKEMVNWFWLGDPKKGSKQDVWVQYADDVAEKLEKAFQKVSVISMIDLNQLVRDKKR